MASGLLLTTQKSKSGDEKLSLDVMSSDSVGDERNPNMDRSINIISETIFTNLIQPN